MNTSRPPTAARSPISSQWPSSPLPAHGPALYHAMSPEAFAFSTGVPGQRYSVSPTAERKSIDRNPPPQKSTTEHDASSGGTVSQGLPLPTVIIRRLPSTMSSEALTSMLLFAEDFVDARFVPLDFPEDSGCVSAIARFRTADGAYEARNRLHGKPNSTSEHAMIVDLFQNSSSGGPGLKRQPSDARSVRQMSITTPAASTGNRQSRFSSTFHSLDRSSPPGLVPDASSSSDFPASESEAQMQSMFSPQSPLSMSFGDRLHISDRSLINDDDEDEETEELLKDPVAYAKSGQKGFLQRQTLNAHPPASRLANLRLDINNTSAANGAHMISPPGSGYGPPRPMPQFQSSASDISPTALTNGMLAMSPTGNFSSSSKQFQRQHQYPPANPADQNPPCNTLYVGNLPVDTSEDELKAMFSKQRGYKRLCFRTKHNGPMCFVEFEDVSFATKALNELYGHPLHNSVKGGIRLSFSKNPFGVRTGQANGMGPQSPLASPNAVSGFGSGVGCPPGFSTANGPPPGLAVPPGLSSPLLSPPMSTGSMSTGNAQLQGGFFGPFGPSSPPIPVTSMPNLKRGQSLTNGYMTSSSGPNISPFGTGFSSYMADR